MNDTFIRVMKLPGGLRAFTKLDDEGDYNIYVNENLSDEARKKAIEHEKDHIDGDDFYKDMTALEIETDRERRAM